VSDYRDPRERRFVRSAEPATEPPVAETDVAVTAMPVTQADIPPVAVVVAVTDPVEAPERRRFVRRSTDDTAPAPPEGRLARRLTAVVEAAYGNPTPHEAAAIAAAVQTILDAEAAATGSEMPEPYRSSWRRAAIHEAVRRMDVP
jgi:hypothetical protein